MAWSGTKGFSRILYHVCQQRLGPKARVARMWWLSQAERVAAWTAHWREGSSVRHVIKASWFRLPFLLPGVRRFSPSLRISKLVTAFMWRYFKTKLHSCWRKPPCMSMYDTVIEHPWQIHVALSRAGKKMKVSIRAGKAALGGVSELPAVYKLFLPPLRAELQNFKKLRSGFTTSLCLIYVRINCKTKPALCLLP